MISITGVHYKIHYPLVLIAKIIQGHLLIKEWIWSNGGMMVAGRNQS